MIGSLPLPKDHGGVDPRPLLMVTGASGFVGRRAVEILLDGGHRVIAGTRTPDRIRDLEARGAELRHVDFDQRDSLDAALRGVDRMLLISTDMLGKPGARLAQQRSAIAAAIAAAVAASVRHIVYTSMARPEPGSLVSFAPDHYETERALAAAPLSWTVLRNGRYTESLVDFLPWAVASGTLTTAAGNGMMSFVTREDCAAAAAAALASTCYENRMYDVTGPEALTKAELAVVLAEIVGRPIELVRASSAKLREDLLAAGLAPFLVELMVGSDESMARGHGSVCTTAVEELTGRAPISVRTFLSAHREQLLAPPSLVPRLAH